MLKSAILLFFVFIFTGAWATHNRSGEITYRHLGGNTYEFTITTCTKLSSEANRDKLEINYGDGFSDTIPLTQFFDYPSTDTKKNLYIGQHTYTGPGSFLISVADPNRNANVLNITNSVDQIFCIQTQLIISPFLGKPNNSLILEDCPCPEEACAGQPWIYNLGAYDPDGDSLRYEIIPCRGEDCVEMPIPSVFQYPNDVGGGSFGIHPEFGTITWDSPSLVGEYNFAIKIKELRNGALIGYVIRDMQITVKGNCLNAPPKITAFADTCIQADSTLAKSLSAKDTSLSSIDNPVLSWDFFGEGFFLSTSPAVFTNTSTDVNPITADFTWTPNCSAIRDQPYLFTFEAADEGPYVSLKDIRSVRVRVNGPPVQNLSGIAALNATDLFWSVSDCPAIIGYSIYRKADSTYTPSDCCGGREAESLGYTKIGETTSRIDTSFQDDGPLYPGFRYCYTVTANYKNGSESCIVAPFCVQLPFDLPIVTHATVVETSNNQGIDSIRWTHPKELDTLLYTGPYHYQLYVGEKFTFPDSLIFSSSIENNLIDCDTFWVDSNLNTFDQPYNYQIAFYNAGQLVGRSAIARTIFLETLPNDNEVGLTWNEVVPWRNFFYEVYRSDDSNPLNFNLIGTTDSTYYVDDSLVNGQIHCYRIKTLGRYSLPTLPDTLINWSQITCTSATDRTAPCAPSDIRIAGDCFSETVSIQWSNPNNSCADDVVGYKLFYAETPDSPFNEIGTLSSDQDTNFVYYGDGSIAGCYYVTALDSAQYGNESEPSEILCIDNCDPNYILPNVFTPNGDDANNLYHPRDPLKFIAKVEFRVFNRWGEQVFYTTDPKINWNGFDQKENLPLLEGVYFYTCTAYAIRLEGLVPFDLAGFIHLIYSK